MNTYEANQQAKLERYKELSEKRRRESGAARETSDRISSMIPMGQPILVGHHSEKRHRRDLDRIQRGMEKSFELEDKAKHYEKKVENILNPTSISSDDPDAASKLREKLQGLEEKRERFKEHNKKARRDGTETLPAYVLSNLGQNIRSVKQRIESLEKLSQVSDSEEKINGITISIDKEDNRIRLYFPDIPSSEVRTKLKQNGFKWSPYNKAWQRMINSWSIQLAREIATEYIEA